LDLRLFITVFVTIFIAELGDKTQLATLLYASDAAHSRLTVFAAAAGALVLTSALGVLVGAAISEVVDPKLVRWASGIGFIAVGVWFLLAGE